MPQIAYCTDSSGYYTHAEQCTIDPLESAKQGRDVYVLPANGYLDAPVIADGCVAQRVDGAWVDVENHIGETGYINGVATEIKEYGALPDGWSTEAPAITTAQALSALHDAREVLLSTYDKHIAQLSRESRLASTDEERAAIAATIALWDAYAVALCDLPEQDGAPWADGDIPWPTAPEA